MKNWISHRGISFKMILFIFLNVFIITTIIFAYIYKVSHDTIYDNLKENSRLLTNSTVYEVEKILTAVQKVPDNLSRIIETGKYSADEIEYFIRLAVETNEEVYGAAISFEPNYNGKLKKYSTVYIYKEKGETKTIYLDKDNTDHLILDWYMIPRELQKPVWSEPYYDEGLGNITMSTYTVPLYENLDGRNTFIGVLTADLSLDWLQKIVAAIKVYDTGYAFMVSRNGSLVTHPKKELIMNTTIFSIAEEANSIQLRNVGRAMVAGRSSFAEVEYRNIATGKLSYISYAPVKINGWSLGIVYPVDELLSSLNSLFRVVMILAVIGGAILLFIIILISRSITRPLRKLAFATQKFSEGNFDVELPMFKAKDEIGELTNSFSVMQDALKQTIEKLKNANDELEEYSRTLEDKVEERTAELKEKNLQLDKALANVKTLSQIGREITATLNMESIFSTVYESVNRLLDANSFSIMVVNEKEQLLECKLAIENGERLPEFSFRWSLRWKRPRCRIT